jgi:hypothetical protein
MEKRVRERRFVIILLNLHLHMFGSVAISDIFQYAFTMTTESSIDIQIED